MSLFEKKKKGYKTQKNAKNKLDFLGLDDELDMDEEYYEDDEYYEEDEYYESEEYDEDDIIDEADYEILEDEVEIYEDETDVSDGVETAVFASSVSYENEDGMYAEDAETEALYDEKGYEEDSEYDDDDEMEFEEYDDDDYDEDEYDQEAFEERRAKLRGRGPEKGIGAVLRMVRDMSVIDKIITLTGVAVVAFGVVTAVVFATARSESKAVDAFAEVGGSLLDVNIIGESGLIAVSNAAANNALLMAETVGMESEEMESESKNASVVMKMTSIVKDLKIKFVNSETEKLIANVPFEVEVTDSSNKTETWVDEDKDGIIYKEGIAGGDYQVKMLPLEGEEYAKYTIDTAAQTTEVKATIEYKKVEIAEEIKDESQVNAAIEDTVIEETVEESKLNDTVPFIASTTKTGAVTYDKIDKSTIPDPSTIAKLTTRTYYLMTQDGDGTGDGGGTGTGDGGGTGTGDGGGTGTGDGSGSGDGTGEGNGSGTGGTTTGGTTTGGTTTGGTTTGGTTTPQVEKPTISGLSSTLALKVGNESTLSADVKGTEPTKTWSSSNTSIATVDGNGKVKAVAVGEATITLKASNSAGDATATCKVTVSAADASLTMVGEQNRTVKVGEKITLQVSTNQTDVSWTCSDTNKATISVSSDKKSCEVTGKAAGKVTVTASTGKISAIFNVEVKEGESLTLDPTELSVAIKKTATIKVAVTPSDTEITGVGIGDKSIATVSWDKNKMTITVTGVKVGTTKVTVTAKNGKTAECKITVKNSAAEDTTSLLKDKNGNQVFVKENGSYRKAVYADYFKFNEFYLEKKETLYTGWQNINGKSYYYLENNKPVTGEQVIQGAKYVFGSDGVLQTGSASFGIDVSKWNGNINWNSVKASGVSYAIIRCGYRGSTTGALIEDPKFAANISGANAAGIKTGVYFFTQAVNEKEAVEEASMVLSLIKKYKISYPIFLDVESSGGRADGIDKATRTAVCKAFCQTIENSGYTAGVYANKTWFTSKIDAGSLGSYKIWLAQYAAKPTYSGRYNIWQYSSKGSVPGISGDVDLNLSYLGY